MFNLLKYMKIHYLFSRNNKIGSKLIAWASGLIIHDLDKVPSHVAVLIGDSVVMESTLDSGVRMIPYSYWKIINEECYKIPCQQIERSEEEIFNAFEKIFKCKYDWLGILFFTKCFIMHILFKASFPKQNRWQSDNKFFCTEFAGRLSEYEKYSMVTPAKMCSDFLKMSKQWQN